MMSNLPYDQCFLEAQDALERMVQNLELGGKPRIGAALVLQTFSRALLNLQLLESKDRACWERQIALFACNVAIDAIDESPRYADLSESAKRSMQDQVKQSALWLARP